MCRKIFALFLCVCACDNAYIQQQIPDPSSRQGVNAQRGGTRRAKVRLPRRRSWGSRVRMRRSTARSRDEAAGRRLLCPVRCISVAARRVPRTITGGLPGAVIPSEAAHGSKCAGQLPRPKITSAGYGRHTLCEGPASPSSCACHAEEVFLRMYNGQPTVAESDRRTVKGAYCAMRRQAPRPPVRSASVCPAGTYACWCSL